jgi:hypothetical protein
MVRRFFGVWLAVGCGGVNDATLIDELRVLAAVADPPDVLAGEAYTLTFTVADPLGEGGAWLAWSCVPELGCASQGGPLEGEEVRVDAIGVAPLPVWFLACAPGACDPASATPAQLEDPEAWMTTLSITGVTLGSRLTRVVEEGATRNENPVILQEPDPIEATTGEEVTLTFVAPGATVARGVTTAGGFTMIETDVGSDGDAELTWIAPDEAGTARLYVIFDDQEGGAAVWTRDVEVR